MAVDSRAKRQSAHRAANRYGWILPNPDGTVAVADRQHVLSFYGGIAAALPSILLPAPRNALGPDDLHRHLGPDGSIRHLGPDNIHRHLGPD